MRQAECAGAADPVPHDGTGTHETTSLCLETLDELPEINKMQFGKPKLPVEEQPAEEHEEGTEHGKEAE